MFALFAAVISYVTVLFQNTPSLYNRICLLDVGPDLVFILILRIALEGRVYQAILFGFTIGLLEDCYAPGFFGLNALFKGTAAFLVASYSEHIFKSNPLIQILLVVITKTIHDIAYLLILHIGELDQFFFLFFRYSLISIAYSGLLTPFIFLLLRPLSMYQKGYR